MTGRQQRQVVANMTITLDGRITGAGGNDDMEWVIDHAFSDTVRTFLAEGVSSASTAVMGSVNAEGYAAVWPAVADDADADDRDRAFSRWLTAADKVVLTSTGRSAWSDARIRDASAVDVVRDLLQEPGGDIVILNSVSVIMPLLEADMIDRFDVVIVPEILGAGRVLFEHPVPPSQWRIETLSTADTGALAVRYARVRG